MPMQINGTATPNNPPTGLMERQLSVEMANTPPTLWCGVPTSVDASGRVQVSPPLGMFLPLIGGELYQAGVGDPLTIRADPTLNAQLVYRIDNTYRWAAGALGNGTFGIADLNAAAYRLTIDPAGLVTIPRNLGVGFDVTVGGNTVPANVGFSGYVYTNNVVTPRSGSLLINAYLDTLNQWRKYGAGAAASISYEQATDDFTISMASAATAAGAVFTWATAMNFDYRAATNVIGAMTGGPLRIGFAPPADQTNGLISTDLCSTDMVLRFNAYVGAGAQLLRVNANPVSAIAGSVADGSLSFFSAASGAAGSAITLTNTMNISNQGLVSPAGAMGGIGFADRTATATWQLFSQGNVFRLWAATDYFAVNGVSGETTIYRNGGAASLRLDGTGTTYFYNHALPSQGATYNCGNAIGLGWDNVCAGNFITIPSGAAYKTDIRRAAPGALAQVMRLEPVEYHFRDKEGPGAPLHRGFIAEDVRRVMGEDFAGYREHKPGLPGLSYPDLVAVLWQAVQELRDEVEVLKGARS